MPRDGAIERQKLTPPEVAKLWGVDPMKIVKLIRSGQLRAMNGALDVNGRPRYLIDRTDVVAFEQQRAVVPTSPSPKRRRKSADVIEFIR